MKEMLQTNGGCELPCWWSIMPGETSWQTAKDFFTSQGIQWLYEDELYFGPPVHDRSVQYGVDLFLVQRGGVVQSIDVRSEPFGDPLLNHFAQDWHRYSLDQVLIQYGKPSQIMLQLTPPMEIDSPAGYLLDIFYGRLGIAIRYLGLATYDGTTIQACPVFEQMTGIGLWLHSKEDEFALVEHFIAPDEMPYFRSLEAATGMSLETFYDIYTNPDSQVCLEGLPTLP